MMEDCEKLILESDIFFAEKNYKDIFSYEYLIKPQQCDIPLLSVIQPIFFTSKYVFLSNTDTAYLILKTNNWFYKLFGRWNCQVETPVGEIIGTFDGRRGYYLLKWKIFDRERKELVILKGNLFKDSIRSLRRKYPLFSLDFITAGEKIGNVIMEGGRRPVLRRITFDLSGDRQRTIDRRLVISLIPLLDSVCYFGGGGC